MEENFFKSSSSSKNIYKYKKMKGKDCQENKLRNSSLSLSFFALTQCLFRIAFLSYDCGGGRNFSHVGGFFFSFQTCAKIVKKYVRTNNKHKESNIFPSFTLFYSFFLFLFFVVADLLHFVLFFLVCDLLVAENVEKSENVRKKKNELKFINFYQTTEELG